MKFWITRLNATPITQLIYNQPEQPISQNSTTRIIREVKGIQQMNKQEGSNQKKIPQQTLFNKQSTPGENNASGTNQQLKKRIIQKQMIKKLKVHDELKGVINHSRTLSLSIYQNDLIYYSRGCQYYYRAKNRLLYILAKDPKENITINSIYNIILTVIKRYQQKCMFLNCDYKKFPRKLSHYQSTQFIKLAEEIKQIIDQQQYLQNYEFDEHREKLLIRRTPSQKQNAFQTYKSNVNEFINGRRQKLEHILSSAQNTGQHPYAFKKATEKHLNKYKQKKHLFILLTLLLTVVSWIMYNYYQSHNEIFI